MDNTLRRRYSIIKDLPSYSDYTGINDMHHMSRSNTKVRLYKRSDNIPMINYNLYQDSDKNYMNSLRNNSAELHIWLSHIFDYYRF